VKRQFQYQQSERGFQGRLKSDASYHHHLCQVPHVDVLYPCIGSLLRPPLGVEEVRGAVPFSP